MLDRCALPFQDVEGDPCFTSGCAQIQDSLVFPTPHPSFLKGEGVEIET